MYYFILFLFFGCVIPFDGRSEDMPVDAVWGDFTYFSQKKVTVLWRGVHFLENHFDDQEVCLRYWNEQRLGNPVYASAAYKMTGIAVGKTPNLRQRTLLFNAARKIQNDVRSLSTKGEITVGKRTFSNHRYAFQHVYSNDYDLFGRVVDRSQTYGYGVLSSGLSFQAGNPFVSCAEEIKPAAHYGAGLKYYGAKATPLTPHYNAEGEPETPLLGVLYGMVLDETMMKEVSPFSVPAHHGAGHIAVSEHYSCNILSEGEVSLVGRVPDRSVVMKYPVTVPSFKGDYNADYRERYGLTLRRYRNIQATLTDAQTSQEQKDVSARSMVEQIISPKREDKAGYCDHTMSKKLGAEMRRRLKTENATQRKTKLQDAA